MKKLFLRGLIATGLFLALSLSAFAVADDYTVAGGDIASLPVVGAAASAINTITLTDAGGDDFSDVNNTEVLIVTLNTTDYPSVQFDQTVLSGGLTIGGNCGHTSAFSLTYPDATTANVTVTGAGGAAQCLTGETITIAGLKVYTIYAATAPAAANLVSVDNSFTSVGSTVASATTMALAITAADAGGTVALDTNAVVGVAGTTTVTLTSPFALDSGDTIDITFPASVDVSAVQAQVATGTFDGDLGVSITCTASSQVITCTPNGATATTGTIIMTGIVSAYVDTAAITSVEIEDEGVAANDIATDTSVTLTARTIGDLTSTNIEPDTLKAGTGTDATVTFTTTAAIPNLGQIVLTFPSGYTVSTANNQVATNLSGLTGTWTASVSGQVVTLTQTGGSAASAGVKSFKISGIQVPSSTGSTGTYTILTKNAAGAANVETDAAVGADTVLASTYGSNASPVTYTATTTTEDETTEATVETNVDPITVTLATQNSSGQSGTATLTEANGKTTVTISTTGGPAGVNQPAHIHIGSCSELGDAKYTLTAVSGNASVTVLDMTIAALKAELPFLAINVHKSAEESSVSYSCGDILATAATDSTEEEVTGEEAVTDEEAGEPMPIAPTSGEFGDTVSHWAKTDITAMTVAGIIKGNPDGTFKPDNNINRAEVAILICRIAGNEGETTTNNPFSDVKAGSWYGGCVSALKTMGVIKGNPDGTYQPTSDINRAEFLTLAMRLYEELVGGVTAETTTTAYTDLKTAWYTGNVATATKLGFVNGSTCGTGKCFYAENPISRAEATAILYRMFKAYLEM